MSQLFSGSYTEENLADDLAKKIYENINTDKDIIIVNIGTDRAIGDCLAPLLGTLLKEKKSKITIYGDVKNPIHALNINKKIALIKAIHPNSYIIGIDACIGDKDEIGNIVLRDSPIQPGIGMGKKLLSVGDLSIVGVVANKPSCFNDIRLDFIYDMASVIRDSILILEKKYIKTLNN